MKKAFLTDAVLIFLLDENFDGMNFYTKLWRSNFGGSIKFQYFLKSQVNIAELFKQIDYYIVGESADEIIYLDLAMRNDVKIFGTRDFPEEIFKNIPVPREVEDYKKKIFTTFAENIVNKFSPLEYEYFLMHDGLGEVLAFFYWFKKYRKHTDKKILTMCIHPSRTELMKICPYVDEVIQIDARVYDYIQIYLSEQYEIKNAYTAHNAPTTLQRYREIPIYYREPANNFFHLAEGRQHFLQIPPETKFERYSVTLPEESVAKAKKIFENLNLKRGKTVFINAEGITVGTSESYKDFWIELAKKLSSAGYKMVINGNNFKIPSCENIFLSIFETSAFIGLCGNVVSVLTGFTEAICALNSVDEIQVQFIHHDERFNWKESGANNFTKLLLLKEMQYFGSDFTEKHIDSYYNWMRRICGDNVKCYPHKWSHTPEEEKILLKKIVERIVEGKKFTDWK